MSKPRYKWWGYVRAVLYAYPSLKRRYTEITRPHYPPGLIAPVSSGKAIRSTESSALRMLSPQEQREYDAVTCAIQITERLDNAAQRLQLIDMVFFRRSHTLQGAAQEIYYSYSHARIFQREFIQTVASCLELM